MMKTVLTISKKWNQPQIKITLGQEGIELQMDMTDFREALKRELGFMEDFRTILKNEIGSITWTFKKETFDKKLDEAWIAHKDIFDKQLDEAIQRIISGVKEESAKVVL